MAKINLQMHFKVRNPNPDQMRQYFQSNQKLRPVRLSVETTYAETLEYGSGPLKYVRGQDYLSLVRDLKYWAMKKDGRGQMMTPAQENTPFGLLPIKNDLEATKFAHRIASRMWNQGCYPHPYYRPAFAWFDANKQRMWDEGKSLYDMLDETKRIMNMIMIQSNLPFSGALQQSIRLRHLELAEVYGLTEEINNGRLLKYIKDRQGIDNNSVNAWGTKRP